MAKQKRRRNWKVITVARAWIGIHAAPLAEHDQAMRWIVDKLPYKPMPKPGAVHGTRGRDIVAPIHSGQYKNRKIQHIRLGKYPSLWRLIYVVLPIWREVYVYDCIQHSEGSDLYSPEYMREMLATVASYRPNPRRVR